MTLTLPASTLRWTSWTVAIAGGALFAWVGTAGLPEKAYAELDAGMTIMVMAFAAFLVTSLFRRPHPRKITARGMGLAGALGGAWTAWQLADPWILGWSAGLGALGCLAILLAMRSMEWRLIRLGHALGLDVVLHADNLRQALLFFPTNPFERDACRHLANRLLEDPERPLVAMDLVRAHRQARVPVQIAYSSGWQENIPPWPLPQAQWQAMVLGEQDEEIKARFDTWKARKQLRAVANERSSEIRPRHQ